MEEIVFCFLAILLALGAVLSRSTGKMIFYFWLCGLALSGAYLSVGAEFLAFVQGVLVTLSCVIYFFFGFLHSRETPGVDPRKFLTSAGLGFTAFGLFCLGMGDRVFEPVARVPEVGLFRIGQYLVSSQFLSLELLGLVLFLVVVGAGVLARR